MEAAGHKQPETARKSTDFLFRSGVVLLFGLFGFQLWFHADRTSVTIDEPVHILAGHRHLQCGDFGINPEHPPLLKMLAAIPLTGRTFIEPDWDCGSKISTKIEDGQAGMFFLAKNGIDSIVLPVRLAASVMSLLLAAVVFLAAREMFGRAEAIVALALLAFEPNFIAHGSLVTTDTALTATMFAAVFALYRYLKNPSAVRFLIVGLAVGLTLAAKHSGLLILPILLLLLIVELFIFRKTEKETRLSRQIFRRAAAFAGIVFVSVALLWAFYGFRFYALPNASENTVSIENFFRNSVRSKAAESLAGQAVLAFNRFHIFPESYNFGLADVVATGSRSMFLFNNAYPTGRWFYFPAAFAIKTSIALLTLLIAGLLTFKFYRMRGREMLFLLVPSILFFAVSLTSQINIGVRHILPVYPFFIVVAAAAACYWARKYPVVRYVLITLLVFHAATAVRIAPHYLAFSNDFWGGVDNTHRFLADSNVEWGQSVKLVSEYAARENIADCWFAGFGNGELNRIQQPCRLIPGSQNWAATDPPVEPTPTVVEGTIFLSVSVLPPLGGDDEYLPVLQTEPIALIGGSILVYRGRFEVPLVAAFSHIGRAGQLMRMNRFEEAVADALKAVELAPEDPRSHIVLGGALVRAGRTDEARRAFETTVRFAAINPALFRQLEMRARAELRRLRE